MTTDGWHFVKDELPPERRLIEATTASGDVVQLRRKGRLYFHPDWGMYVYYEPVKWRLVDESLEGT